MALERDVGGRDTRMAGLVRVTCAETVATHNRQTPCIRVALTHITEWVRRQAGELLSVGTGETAPADGGPEH